MPTESLLILYLGIGLLFVVLMGLAVQTIAERSTNLRVGQKKMPSTCSAPSLTLSKPTSIGFTLTCSGPSLTLSKPTSMGFTLTCSDLSLKLSKPTSMRLKPNLRW